MSCMEESDKGILVQEMVKGAENWVVGLTPRQVVGPCVMFGLGGISPRSSKTFSFRVAPIEKRDALEMPEKSKLTRFSMQSGDASGGHGQAVRYPHHHGDIGMENDEIKEIDVNPLIISGAMPVAVDAPGKS